MSKDIYVFIEQRDNKLEKVGIELLGKARELADRLNEQVVAMLIGEKVKGHSDLLIHHGADKVIVIEDPMLKEYVTEPYAKSVFHIIKKYEPEIVLFGASSIGRDLAPRMAARIHTGLTADCTKLDIEDESNLLLMTRPAFGGNLMATIVCENFRPQMATVRPAWCLCTITETGGGRAREFADLSYATIIARYFNADYTLIAHSGRGVVRNYGGLYPCRK